MTDRFSPWRFCVAPMLDWTDRHCRRFHRALTRHARLYTEMVTSPAILHGNKDYLLGFSAEEHPVACQLGGSDPVELAFCAKVVQSYGYDEINLNCGCPSERVQKGSFGACLMLEPKLVAECFKAMQDAVTIPVTVKHRVGVDDVESYDFVRDFVGTLYEAGCRAFIVHCRKALLKGLSPKENREVPPLKREVAYRLKKDFPAATICVNGGIHSIREVEDILQHVDGVMLGREAYTNPWLLTQVDAELFDDDHNPVTRDAVIKEMTEYLKIGVDQNPMILRGTARHMLGLLNGLAGARGFRRFLSDVNAYKTFGADVLNQAYARAGWGEFAVKNNRFDEDEF